MQKTRTWELKNPEDFMVSDWQKLRSATIEYRHPLYIGTIQPDPYYFNDTLTTSLRQIKRLVREHVVPDRNHLKTKMKWEQI